MTWPILAGGAVAAAAAVVLVLRARRRARTWTVQVGGRRTWTADQLLRRGVELVQVGQGYGASGSVATFRVPGLPEDPYGALQLGSRVLVRYGRRVVFRGEVVERGLGLWGSTVTCRGPLWVAHRVVAHRALEEDLGACPTIGERIRALFDANAQELEALGAAPAGRRAYVQAELDELDVRVPDPRPAGSFLQVLEHLAGLAGRSVYVDPHTLTWHLVAPHGHAFHQVILDELHPTPPEATT